MVGTRRSPTPNDMAAARTKRSRRVNRLYDSTRIPDVATVANKKVVTPPRTGLGTDINQVSIWANTATFARNVLAKKTPDIFPRTPNRMRKRQQKRPAVRFAQRVIAMTPLF